MSTVNKAIIIGNLGNDPETRYAANGTAITSLSVATTETWKDSSGEKQERTEWHRVTMFGKLAEIAGEYLKKGGKVYIEGRIQTDKYTDREGIERYATKIIANEMKMLGGRDDRGEGGGRERGDRGRGERASAQYPLADQPDFKDDDIPF